MERVMMWWNYDWQGPWMFVGPLMMIAFVVLCIIMMRFMMRGMCARNDNAVDILKDRYARGEINQAEFEERRRLLKA
jgi:putative membrane protein